MAAQFDVQLWRYDLSQGMARSMSMMLLGEQLEGIWHTAVVVYGKEFFFNGGVGVEVSPLPGSTQFGAPYATEPIGRTQKTLEEFLTWVSQQRRNGFGPTDYNLLTNNCNHFSQAAVRYLVGVDIPEDIRTMIPRIMSTPLGRMLAPMITQTVGAIGNDNRGSSAVPLTTSGMPMGLASQSSPSHPSRLSVPNFNARKEHLTEDEEETLLMAKLMFESCEIPFDPNIDTPYSKKLEAVKVVEKIFQKILNDPGEERYRSISTSSATYTSKLLPFEEFGLLDILKLAGFRISQNPSSNGQRWLLTDADANRILLERMMSEMKDLTRRIETKAEKETNSLQPVIDRASLGSAFAYCVPPFSDQYTPLNIDPHCSHNSLFSILQLRGGDENHVFGKCQFKTDMSHLNAWVCTKTGLEESVASGSYAVLCVKKGFEDQAMWIPARLALVERPYNYGIGAASYIFHPTEHCGIVRAFRNGEAHPGVMEPSGECYIPYAGKALNVTQDAQVLCVRDRMPPELIEEVEKLYEGESYLSECLELSGYPIKTLTQLCNCALDAPIPISPPLELRSLVSHVGHETEVKQASASRAKLLICHDMRGGYQPGDYAFFSAAIDSPTIHQVYTPEYWNLVDYFVYFSHHRISVPPREWVSAGHKNGVPVLGTMLLEGGEGSSEINFLLTNPKQMALVITSLVELCNLHSFDGYLINCEVSTSSKLAKRLISFCKMLRSALQSQSPKDNLSTRQRYVMWYDAITSTGELKYQNALTDLNEPFFEVADGIMTNYFWNSTHLQLTQAKSSPLKRERDCFVGLDVFGRQMHCGGKYQCGKAAMEANQRSLSVGLFAPGWTLECESNGNRERYLNAESRLWSTLQHPFQGRSSLVMSGTSLATCFTSGAGNNFALHGNAMTTSSPFCQLSGAHLLPPFQYCEPHDNRSAPGQEANRSNSYQQFRLPLGAIYEENGLKGSEPSFSPKGAEARWIYASTERRGDVWFGDRSLEVHLPPLHHVQLLDWRIPLMHQGSLTELLVVDFAVCVGEVDTTGSSGSAPFGRIAAKFLKPDGEIQISEWRVQEVSPSVIQRRGNWVVLRYLVPTLLEDASVAGISIVHLDSSSNPLVCRVGGLAITRVLPAEKQDQMEDGLRRPSPLVFGTAKKWPSAKMLETLHSTERIVVLPKIDEVIRMEESACGKEWLRVVLLAEIADADDNNQRSIYLGQHLLQWKQGLNPKKNEFPIRISDVHEDFKLIMVKYLTAVESL